MALPIKPTPILTDRAAKEFQKQRSENERKAISTSDYLKAKKAYEACIEAWKRAYEM
jgi:hypothetical protein